MVSAFLTGWNPRRQVLTAPSFRDEIAHVRPVPDAGCPSALALPALCPARISVSAEHAEDLRSRGCELQHLSRALSRQAHFRGRARLSTSPHFSRAQSHLDQPDHGGATILLRHYPRAEVRIRAESLCPQGGHIASRGGAGQSRALFEGSNRSPSVHRRHLGKDGTGGLDVLVITPTAYASAVSEPCNRSTDTAAAARGQRTGFISPPTADPNDRACHV